MKHTSESSSVHVGSADCGDPKCQHCKLKRPFELPSEIVEACNRGELVIFAGAGVSTESKGVFRGKFYEAIKDELGINDSNISFSKLMSLYCSSKSRKDLLLVIKQRIDYVKAFPELY